MSRPQSSRSRRELCSRRPRPADGRLSPSRAVRRYRRGRCGHDCRDGDTESSAVVTATLRARRGWQLCDSSTTSSSLGCCSWAASASVTNSGRSGSGCSCCCCTSPYGCPSCRHGWSPVTVSSLSPSWGPSGIKNGIDLFTLPDRASTPRGVLLEPYRYTRLQRLITPVLTPEFHDPSIPPQPPGGR